jgi:serine/threonine protein kinase
MGLSAKTNQLYMIDFGLSKRYRKRKTGAHISFETGKSLTGTVRYLSVNAHRGYELSRRDDLEAIGHMILYFFKGWLPW